MIILKRHGQARAVKDMNARLGAHSPTKYLADMVVEPVDETPPGNIIRFLVEIADLLQKLADHVTVKGSLHRRSLARETVAGLINDDLNA